MKPLSIKKYCLPARDNTLPVALHSTVQFDNQRQTMEPKPLITATTDADLPAITEIFAEEVLHGTASWAYTPPTLAEMTDKFHRLNGDNFPWLSAHYNNKIVGFSFASAYRPREGYRFLVEDSIYTHAEYRRQGIASELLATLLTECSSRGYRQMVAVIGDSANTSSIALHQRMGFSHAGLLKNVGYKFDRWLDSVLMQKEL